MYDFLEETSEFNLQIQSWVSVFILVEVLGVFS